MHPYHDYMARSLAAFDPHYGAMASLMTLQEKIDYCNKLIDTAQGRLSKDKSNMSPELKDNLARIILSAQQEIKTLMNVV
jgi:hypothetical protein